MPPGTDPRTALQLGIAAQRIHPGGETHASLINTLTNTFYAHSLGAHRPGVLGGVLPDGRTLATGSDDTTVRMRDLADRTRPSPLGPPLTGHTDRVVSVAFAPDGHTLATSSDDATVRLWDLTDRTRPSPLGPPLTGHTDRVVLMVVAPDGHTLATSSWIRPCGCGTSPTAPDPARWAHP